MVRQSVSFPRVHPIPGGSPTCPGAPFCNTSPSLIKSACLLELCPDFQHWHLARRELNQPPSLPLLLPSHVRGPAPCPSDPGAVVPYRSGGLGSGGVAFGDYAPRAGVYSGPGMRAVYNGLIFFSPFNLCVGCVFQAKSQHFICVNILHVRFFLGALSTLPFLSVLENKLPVPREVFFYRRTPSSI